MITTSNALRFVFASSFLLAVPLLCGAKGTGCGDGTVVIGGDGGGGMASGTASSSTASGGTCTSAQCGPQLGLLNYTCPDGVTIGGPTGKCLPTPSGCGWEVIQCPAADECAVGACGPQLGLPNQKCDDGSIGGPTGRCLKNSDGVCGWEVRACPPKSGFKWFTTCGDPLCKTPDPDDPNVPNCVDEMAGAACSTPGATCEVPGDSCGANLVCAAEDPKSGTCPVSRASAKYGIDYLAPADLKRLSDDLLDMRMARWHYLTESNQTREHTGFIIDDQPNSPAVAPDGNHVDLYGYTSMAVAAIQVQQKQIEALEREVRALESKVDGCRRGDLK